MTAALLSGVAFAADIKVLPLATPKPFATPNTVTPPQPEATSKDIPIQQSQPNCSHWTDECVICARGAPGSQPTCSNIGFACQPKAIRCLSGDIPQSEPRK